MNQINPPFNGSQACPMCQEQVRGIAALLHNAFMRFGEVKMFVNLYDLREYAGDRVTLTVPHPATQAMLDLVGKMVAILKEGMTAHQGEIRWSPECTQAIMALREPWREVLIALDPLSEAHFHDDRHSRNEPNRLHRLHRQCGGRGDLYHEGTGSTSYDYTVTPVVEGGDITHRPCGTSFALHAHFKTRIDADPTFYGQVHCSTCGLFLPIDQFDVHLIGTEVVYVPPGGLI